ncbi:stAR-related lipid transfer protein 3-like isoform X2 [Amphiura filiformis]|uniref:stAR-related lipid transfer protein 3-like isoform X2 n=1 Tax=Amphiura filiformis TaxID=82378 RepID=UPI003B223B12
MFILDTEMSINTVSPTDERDMTDAVQNRNESARQAANVLYASRSNSNDPIPRQSHSNGMAAAGVSERELKFSSVRRMFCLLTAFDFLLMLLLWIIYINIIGLGIRNGMICQVINYDFKTSMFDVVALSFVRMGLLLIAYAGFKSRHWAMVAITTAITSALLLSKVFIYDFSYDAHKEDKCVLYTDVAHPVDYILLITSFTVAWIEVWVLDFKVIPRERRMLASVHHHSISQSGNSERTPLLSEQNTYRSPTLYGGQQGFYSPIGTPKESDTESESGEESPYSGSYKTGFQSLPNSQRGSSVNLAASIQEQEYIQKAKESTKIMDKVLATKEGWVMEKQSDTVTLDSHTFEGITGKVYRLMGDVPIAAEQLVHILWEDIDNTRQWNNTVLEVKTLQQIDDHIDIIYTQAAPGPGNVVASRDFVIVRNYWERGDRHQCSSIGAEHPAKPPTDNIVRGYNGTGGWVIEPVEGDQTKCKFTWLLHSDLKFKVWTPQAIIDTALCHVLFEMHSNLIKHVQKTYLDSTTVSVDETGDAGNQPS